MSIALVRDSLLSGAPPNNPYGIPNVCFEFSNLTKASFDVGAATDAGVAAVYCDWLQGLTAGFLAAFVDGFNAAVAGVAPRRAAAFEEARARGRQDGAEKRSRDEAAAEGRTGAMAAAAAEADAMTFLNGESGGDGEDGGGGGGGGEDGGGGGAGGGATRHHAAAMTLLARPADDETRRSRAEWRYDVSATPRMHVPDGSRMQYAPFAFDRARLREHSLCGPRDAATGAAVTTLGDRAVAGLCAPPYREGRTRVELPPPDDDGNVGLDSNEEGNGGFAQDGEALLGGA